MIHGNHLLQGNAAGTFTAELVGLRKKHSGFNRLLEDVSTSDVIYSARKTNDPEQIVALLDRLLAHRSLIEFPDSLKARLVFWRDFFDQIESARMAHSLLEGYFEESKTPLA